MKNVTVTCDRCGKVVHGIIDEFYLDKTIKVTGGFYDVTDEYWSQFARWEEERICDDCMFADPKYKAIYGDLPAAKVDPPDF